ncbi:two pore domain potassium channel family protein [Clostridium sp. Sa3CUN1]|uniref:Two pore domain potassium channel family protein n=1 Tax=Clostridium gallinarum TaxID=2762246 RepID=A0ABR8Q0T7_9CLOT|nr:potassium channel family protein [Clostridium gallinarum]MBD7914030.1 two pore domain potassium channel family protein [Clostridium gallinarum]
MKGKTLYELFIGLLALMLSVMLILDLMYKLPLMVVKSFYYINFIVSILFLCDYIIRIIISKKKINFIINNIVDFLSTIPFIVIGIAILRLDILNFINLKVRIEIVKVILLIILIIKFKNKIKETVKVNKFNYLLIVTTIIIVLGAVIISLLEDMTFGDAIWWSFVTFTTVGYGDVLLTTSLGRLVAIILMIFGIGFIGITTSTIAAYIVNKDIRRDKKRNFRDETIEFIKYRIDNLDNISDEELDNIYKTLRVLRENKKG